MIRSTLVYFLKGFAMGSADLVPGISGATIALVLNVYQPFIRSIKHFLSVESIRLLLARRWKDFAEFVNLKLILPLGIGIFTCIFTFAHLIAYLLEHQPIPFWSFFFGLILASALVLPDYRQRFHAGKILLFSAGIASGYLLVSLNTLTTPDNIPMIFLAGVVSLGAMLLPGISGSFMLVVIGKYPLLIHAVKDLNFEILETFILGGIVSLIVFPRIIDMIFKFGKEWFIVLISGFLIGSLKKIWPWRLTEPVTGQESAVSPFYFREILSQDPQILEAVLFMVLGIFMIIAVQFLEKRFSNR